MAKSSKKTKIKKEEFEQLVNTVKKLEDDVREIKERLESLPAGEIAEIPEDKLKELSESLRGQLAEEIERLSSELSSLKERLESISEVPEIKPEDIDALRSQVTDQIAEIREQVSNLQERLEALEGAIKEIGDSVDLKLDPLRNELQSMKERISEVGSSLHSLDEKVRGLEETFTETYGEIEEKLQENVSKLSQEISALKERLEGLEFPSLEEISSKLSSELTGQLAEQLTDQIMNLTSELNSIRSNVSMLESTLEDVNQLRSDVQTKLSDVEMLSSTLEQLRSSLHELSERLEKLEPIRDKLEELANQQEYVQSRFGDVQSAFNELSEKVSEIEAQLNQVSADMNSKLETLQELLSSLDPSVVEKATEVSEQVGHLSERLDQLDERLKVIDEVESELQKLRDELQSLSQQIIDRESIQFMIDTTQEQRIEELLRRIEEVEERLGLSPDKLVSLMESDDVKSVIDRMQDEKIAELERKIEELRAQDRSVFQQMIDEAQDQQIRELDERLKELEEKLASMTKEEMSKIDEIQNAKISALESKLEELSKRLDDAMELIKALKAGPAPEALEKEEEEELQPSPDFKLTMSILLEKVMLRPDIDATDLHIKPDNRPVVRIGGQLHPVGKYVLTAGDAYKLIREITKPSHLAILRKQGSVNFSFNFKDTRFRANVFKQINGYAAAIRKIKSEISSFEELNLPSVLEKLSQLRDGLIIVTGPTGSGKSTTIAAMIEYINQNFAKRIITIEDPIEYLFKDKESVISQREVGVDTPSYFDGLKDALREDPDVIFIGELRDPETTWVATTAAETGHLVLTTLHSSDTIQAINRLLDMFMGEQKVQFRFLLAASLKAIIAQKLIERKDGKGLVPAVEIMVVTPTIRSLIREGNIDEIYDYILEGEFDGMQTFSDSLADLVQKGLIDRETAMMYAERPEEFSRKMAERTLSGGREIEF